MIVFHSSIINYVKELTERDITYIRFDGKCSFRGYVFLRIMDYTFWYSNCKKMQRLHGNVIIPIFKDDYGVKVKWID